MSYNKAFTRSEYEQRVDKVKQRMQVAGFDLLICQDPASMGWLIDRGVAMETIALLCLAHVVIGSALTLVAFRDLRIREQPPAD